MSTFSDQRFVYEAILRNWPKSGFKVRYFLFRTSHCQTLGGLRKPPYPEGSKRSTLRSNTTQFGTYKAVYLSNEWNLSYEKGSRPDGEIPSAPEGARPSLQGTCQEYSRLHEFKPEAGARHTPYQSMVPIFHFLWPWPTRGSPVQGRAQSQTNWASSSSRTIHCQKGSTRAPTGLQK